MNMRWLNHFLLVATAISIAAASMGAIIRPPSMDGAVRGNPGKATATSPDVILPAVEALETNQSLSALANEAWGEGWTESWRELGDLRKMRPAGDSIPKMPTQDDFIRIMLGNANLKNELATLLSVPDRPDLASYKKDLTAIGEYGTLREISDILTKKNVLDGFRIPPAEPSPEIDKNINLAGFNFVLIGETPHWITVQEVAAGRYEGEHHGSTEIKRVREAGGFLENWSVRRPRENEWKTARDQPPALGMENFKGGLGEVLDDGKIIGAADGYPKSVGLGALAKQERDRATRIMMRPERRPPDPRNPVVIPAEFKSETNFATRIVIVPPTD